MFNRTSLLRVATLCALATLPAQLQATKQAPTLPKATEVSTVVTKPSTGSSTQPALQEKQVPEQEAHEKTQARPANTKWKLIEATTLYYVINFGVPFLIFYTINPSTITPYFLVLLGILALPYLGTCLALLMMDYPTFDPWHDVWTLSSSAKAALVAPWILDILFFIVALSLSYSGIKDWQDTFTLLYFVLLPKHLIFQVFLTINGFWHDLGAPVQDEAKEASPADGEKKPDASPARQAKKQEVKRNPKVKKKPTKHPKTFKKGAKAVKRKHSAKKAA